MNSVGSLRVEGNARVQVGDSHSNVHHHYEASRGGHNIDQRNDLLRRLNTTPYVERKNRNPRRVVGTCEWFTAHRFFRNWRRETSALLWVSADPGCGKSVLARYLVDEVIPSNVTRRTCYFFFKDDYDDQKTAEGALRCILHQLFVQEPALLSDEILYRYEIEKDQYLSSFSKLWSLLVEIAGKHEHGEIVCVLDALDECEGHTLLAEVLTQLYSKDIKPAGLKFILTSRPYRKHQREFYDLVQSQPTIHLRGESQEEADKIAAEITIAVQQRADDLCRRLPIFLEERQFMEEELAKIEQRTYLWVDLVFNHLENAVFHNKHEFRDCIHDLPHTVDAAYEQILHKSADPAKAKKIFHIIMAAERPLFLAEMAAMLALREDQLSHKDLERDILIHDSLFIEIREACGLFIIINDLKIFFLHQTAREFLLQAPSQLSGQGWQHSIDMQVSHRVMSRLCIQYLWFPELQKLKYDHKTTQPFVLLEYAAENWTMHYRQGRDADARLQSLALKLCDTHFSIAKFWMAAHIWRVLGRFSIESMLLEFSTSLLIVASYFGLDGLVNCILQEDRQQGKNSCLNQKSFFKSRTALSWAIEQGHDPVVRLLLGRVPDWQVKLMDKLHTPITTIVNRKDSEGRTPLSCAAECNYPKIVRQLVEKGARIRARDDDKDTPLLRAIKSGNVEVVDFLLSCDARKALKSKQLKTRDSEGQTLIGIAVTDASWQTDSGVILRLLLDHGADVNASDENGTTALAHASRYGTSEIVKLLLERGADVNASNKDGTTVLGNATYGTPEVVQLLLDHGADVNASQKNGSTALGHASSCGQLKTLLLDRGANIEAPAQWGITTLIAASKRGKLETLKLLLDRGADIDAFDRFRNTALVTAASKHGEPATVKLLLDRGANIEALGRHGETPLIAASRNGKLETVQLLLDQGADIEARDRNGKTALNATAASDYGTQETINLLLHRGADVNARDTSGETALIGSSRAKDYDMTKLLLENGADVNSRDVSGKTALAYVLRRKSRWRDPLRRGDQSLSKSLTKLLTDHGAV